MASFQPVSTTDPKYKKGVEIITFFHNASKKYPAYKFKTVEDLLKVYGLKGPILAQGLGRTFLISENPLSDAKSAMEKLAVLSKGRTPIWQAYGDAMTDSLTATNYWQFVTEVATESAKSVAKGIQSVGETAIETGKNLQTVIKWAPFVLLGVAGLVVFLKMKTLVGKR
jgi:hypothetical protein